ncbi:hypothetical protein RIF29_14834 [Crotalaria pallida]|uniref:Ubiquitin-like protease family profile domain-containing protein n=1 Tax=Crotalaria pallida TaxID=3830 RepID=A0AAN9FEI0_CROPI
MALLLLLNHLRLFSTPPANPKSNPKGNQSTAASGSIGSQSQRGKAPKHKSQSFPRLLKGRGMTIPRVLKTMFKAPADVNFAPKEAQLFAYVFTEDLDITECLVNIEGTKAWRLDFLCFTPGRQISEKLLTLLTLKSTLRQKFYCCTVTWCLPPVFAIYVPIKYEGIWYLMVLSIPDRVVYQLDACYFESQIEPRRDVIKNVCAMLYNMMITMNHGEKWHASACDCVNWPIQDARGIPNLPQSNNSGVWMLKWLQLDEHFKPNQVGELQETNVRINTAVGLIMDPKTRRKLPLR